MDYRHYGQNSSHYVKPIVALEWGSHLTFHYDGLARNVGAAQHPAAKVHAAPLLGRDIGRCYIKDGLVSY